MFQGHSLQSSHPLLLPLSLKPVLRDSLEGWGQGGGRGVQGGGTQAYLGPVHTDGWQKPSQHCNYLPIKKIFLKIEPGFW